MRLVRYDGDPASLSSYDVVYRISPEGTVTTQVAGFGRPQGIAFDASGTLLDVARNKAGALSGKRIYFRSERAQKLSFANDVYDLIVANLGFADVDEPRTAVKEWVRVLKPGGTLALTCAARGTWQEFFDIYREVLVKFYGPEKGQQVRYAETFEVCEYGRRPSAEELRKLFPFFE